MATACQGLDLAHGLSGHNQNKALCLPGGHHPAPRTRMSSWVSTERRLALSPYSPVPAQNQPPMPLGAVAWRMEPHPTWTPQHSHSKHQGGPKVRQGSFLSCVCVCVYMQEHPVKVHSCAPGHTSLSLCVCVHKPQWIQVHGLGH